MRRKYPSIYKDEIKKYKGREDVKKKKENLEKIREFIAGQDRVTNNDVEKLTDEELRRKAGFFSGRPVNF